MPKGETPNRKNFWFFSKCNPDIANSQDLYTHSYKHFFSRYKVFKCIKMGESLNLNLKSLVKIGIYFCWLMVKRKPGRLINLRIMWKQTDNHWQGGYRFVFLLKYQFLWNRQENSVDSTKNKVGLALNC